MLVVLIINTKNIDKKVKIIFLVLSFIEFIELLAYQLELITASWDKPTNLRIFLSAVGYSIKPFIIYLIILIDTRASTKKGAKLLLLVPILIGVILSFSAFFTDIAYSYDAQNAFHRGPLGFFSQILIILYLLICIIISIVGQIKYHKHESGDLEITTLAIGAVFITLAIVFEAVYKIRSIGRSAVVFSTLFYFIYFIRVQYRISFDNTNHLIKLDGLTGLYNKIGFTEKARKSLMISSNSQDAILFVDIDKFKSVNDTYGHLVGDDILVSVTEELKNSFKEYGFIGRFGGDEFYIYMENITKNIVEQKIKELHDRLSSKKYGANQNIAVSLSIGTIIFSKKETHEFSALITKADELLYTAKKRKGNDYSIINVEE